MSAGQLHPVLENATYRKLCTSGQSPEKGTKTDKDLENMTYYYRLEESS